MRPRRIQMTRNRPWRADHPDAVIVDRRTKWGNPWKVESRIYRHLSKLPIRWDVINVHGRPTFPMIHATFDTKAEALADALRRYREHYEDEETGAASIARSELAGKDLACWCPLDQACHADVLLELANGADQ